MFRHVFSRAAATWLAVRVASDMSELFRLGCGDGRGLGNPRFILPSLGHSPPTALSVSVPIYIFLSDDGRNKRLEDILLGGGRCQKCPSGFVSQPDELDKIPCIVL